MLTIDKVNKKEEGCVEDTSASHLVWENTQIMKIMLGSLEQPLILDWNLTDLYLSLPTYYFLN